jgi:hypothetical protein
MINMKIQVYTQADLALCVLKVGGHLFLQALLQYCSGMAKDGQENGCNGVE